MELSAEHTVGKHKTHQITFNKGGKLSRVASWPNMISNTFTVEIIVCLFGLGYYMPNPFVQNLVIEKLCAKKYSAKLCTRGVINSTIEQEVQQEAAQFLMVHHLVRQIPSCVLCLFMGAWSDIYGRKFSIVVPLVGNALTSFLYFLNYYFSDWPAEYIMIASIPAGLTGDYGGFFLGIPGFIKDNHKSGAITQRISRMDGTECVTTQLGPLIGGQLFSRFGYAAVFGCSIVLHVLAALFAYFKVRDKTHENVGWKDKLGDFFRYGAILENGKTVLKKRSQNKKSHILWLLVVVLLSSSAYHGNLEIIYLYTRFKFNWTVIIFSYYNLVVGGCQAISSFLVLPTLLYFFRLSDVAFGILGQIAFVCHLLGNGFVNDTVGMFCVAIVLLMGQLSYITQRACLTKWVSDSEVGKIMSIFAILQAVGRNVGQIVATQIYVATISTYVSAFYLCAAIALLINVGIYGWIFIDIKSHDSPQHIEDPSKETETNC